MRAFFVTLFVVCSPFITQAAQLNKAEAGAKTIQFDDLLRLIREKNEKVAAAQLTVEAKRARTGHLTRSFLPKVSAKAGREYFEFGELSAQKNFWRAEGSVNLFRGGRDHLEEKARRKEVDVAQTNLSKEFIQELQEAQKNYAELVATELLIEERATALKQISQHLKSAQRRARSGIATKTDAVQLELHETLLRQEVKRLTLEMHLLRNKLAVAIGVESGEQIVVPLKLEHPPENEFASRTLAADESIETKALREQSQAQALLAEKEKRSWFPTVDLYTGYGVPQLSDEFERARTNQKEIVAGVKVEIGLSDFFESRAEGAAKQLEAQALQKRAAHKVREIISIDHELRDDLRLLHELIHDSEKDIEKARAFLKLTQAEYTRGSKNGPDLLAAFQNYFSFTDRRIYLYRDYAFARAELSAILGPEVR